MFVRLISERHGERIYDRVMVGEDADHLRLAGTLVFGTGEWQEFGAALLLGAGQMHGNLKVEFVGDDAVVRPDGRDGE